jgi:uncharacterized protein YbbC (DUF1343 family)
MCGGVQLHVLDRQRFEPYLTGILAISTARSMYLDAFRWREPPYEYEYEKQPIEILAGGSRIPAVMEAGAAPGDIRKSWQEDVRDFERRRAPYLLYS